MTITHIQVISIPVTDQDRAKDFYVKNLGFDLIRDFPMGEDRWIQVAPPGNPCSIVLTTWFPSMPPGSTKGLVLETDDLGADVEELRLKGIKFASEILEEPWGRFITFEDPDGNGLILQATTTGSN